MHKINIYENTFSGRHMKSMFIFISSNTFLVKTYCITIKYTLQYYTRFWNDFIEVSGGFAALNGGSVDKYCILWSGNFWCDNKMKFDIFGEHVCTVDCNAGCIAECWSFWCENWERSGTDKPLSEETEDWDKLFV